MRQSYRIWAIILLMILTWVSQFNIVTDYKASKYLKEEIELALHDAGLFLDLEQFAEGFVVFDRNQAYDAFVESIEKNTNLRHLAPTGDTFYQDAFHVVAFEVFDDSNSVFPVHYIHPGLTTSRSFYSPTIYVIVETYGPRFFPGSKNLLRRDAAYTYIPPL